MILLCESEGLSSITDVSYLGIDTFISLSQSNPLSSPQRLWDGSNECICICICTIPQYWWLNTWIVCTCFVCMVGYTQVSCWSVMNLGNLWNFILC